MTDDAFRAGMDERAAADVMWDALAELGIYDGRGGAEYRREFASAERVHQLSQAAFGIVGRLMIAARADPVDAQPPEDRPYYGDEPLGTCVIHGDYWTDDCLRCGGRG